MRTEKLSIQLCKLAPFVAAERSRRGKCPAAASLCWPDSVTSRSTSVSLGLAIGRRGGHHTADQTAHIPDSCDTDNIQPPPQSWAFADSLAACSTWRACLADFVALQTPTVDQLQRWQGIPDCVHTSVPQVSNAPTDCQLSVWQRRASSAERAFAAKTVNRDIHCPESNYSRWPKKYCANELLSFGAVPHVCKLQKYATLA